MWGVYVKPETVGSGGRLSDVISFNSESAIIWSAGERVLRAMASSAFHVSIELFRVPPILSHPDIRHHRHP